MRRRERLETIELALYRHWTELLPDVGAAMTSAILIDQRHQTCAHSAIRIQRKVLCTVRSSFVGSLGMESMYQGSA